MCGDDLCMGVVGMCVEVVDELELVWWDCIEMCEWFVFECE